MTPVRNSQTWRGVALSGASPVIIATVPKYSSWLTAAICIFWLLGGCGRVLPATTLSQPSDGGKSTPPARQWPLFPSLGSGKSDIACPVGRLRGTAR